MCLSAGVCLFAAEQHDVPRNRSHTLLSEVYVPACRCALLTLARLLLAQGTCPRTVYTPFTQHLHAGGTANPCLPHQAAHISFAKRRLPPLHSVLTVPACRCQVPNSAWLLTLGTSMLHPPKCRSYTSYSAPNAPACRCGTPTPGRAWWLPSTCRALPGPASGASSSFTTHPRLSSPPA